MAGSGAEGSARLWLVWAGGGLLLFAALVAAILGAAGLSEVFLAPQRNLHHATIYDSGYQVVRVRTSQYGPIQTSRIPIVKVRVDDGSRHTIESTPLFRLYNAAHRDLAVDVQLDSYDAPKRVRYNGRWYGAGPPVWFWAGFAVVLFALSALLARWGVRRLRRHRRLSA